MASFERASDVELLAAWRTGSSPAARELVLRHYAQVFRYFEAKVPRAAADLTQATFLACHESRHRYQGRSSFRSFLFGIARYKLLRHLRNANRLELVPSFAEVPLGGTPLSTLLSRADDQRALAAAIAELDVDTRVAIRLHYWENKTVAEIAEVLDINPGAVSTRLCRARRRLARAIAVASGTHRPTRP